MHQTNIRSVACQYLQLCAVVVGIICVWLILPTTGLKACIGRQFPPLPPPRPPPPPTTTPQSNVPAQYSMLWVTLQILVGGPTKKHIPSASTGLQYRMQVYAAIHKAVHFPPAMQGARL